jgi:hypothetical protein
MSALSGLDEGISAYPIRADLIEDGGIDPPDLLHTHAAKVASQKSGMQQP